MNGERSEMLELFEKIKPFLDDEKCRTCDCLQGALVELSLSGDEHLKALVEPHRIMATEMHGCLGCEPCPPAEFWTEFRKRSQQKT